MLAFRIIKIQGHSMEPALRAGSYALVRQTGNFRKGDLALFQLKGALPMVKRISEVDNGRYYVIGDNQSDSLDSRTLGWISKESMIGKVIWY